ncbi:hypothetical protein M758_UG279200 [Ceratodon purpureus]|nr:hypothetical protein M758_UG279200 [Ceratodon purpureus]
MHAEVGEAIHVGRSLRELLKESIYFDSHTYYPAEPPLLFGDLVPAPLPPFSDPSWQLSDMASSEAFRAKLFQDFRKCMKSSSGSRSTHIQWFMPIGIFIDLFAVADNIHRTPTLFVIKNLTDTAFASLMDDGWDCTIVAAEDEIKCSVARPSVVFRYHAGRQTLYTNFHFNRSRIVDGKWEDMDMGESCELVEVKCILEGFLDTVFVVGKHWPLSTVRQEISIALDESAPEEYTFIAEKGEGDIKVNRQHEKKTLASTVVAPKFVRVVADT